MEHADYSETALGALVRSLYQRGILSCRHFRLLFALLFGVSHTPPRWNTPGALLLSSMKSQAQHTERESGGKKMTRQGDRVHQQSTKLTALTSESPKTHNMLNPKQRAKALAAGWDKAVFILLIGLKYIPVPPKGVHTFRKSTEGALLFLVARIESCTTVGNSGACAARANYTAPKAATRKPS